MGKIDADHICGSIDPQLALRLASVEVFEQIDSTNEYLLGMRSPTAGQGRVAIAESQSAGRGSHGRNWHSPSDSGIYLSFAYTFGTAPANLPCLTLVAGIEVVRSLEHLGISGLSLKWPNDVVSVDGKVAGILAESSPSRNGTMTVVVGIGVNVDLSMAGNSPGGKKLLRNAADLNACTSELPDRTMICVALSESLFNSVVGYEARGLDPYVKEWRRLDWLLGKRVSVDGGEISGIANGIDDNGALLIHAEKEYLRVTTGSVRVIQ